jgi:hypothetical protein
VIEFYKHGVNADVVRPVSFSELVTAIKQLGVFWMTVNEPLPVAWIKTEIENSSLTFPGNKWRSNEINDVPGPQNEPS